MERAEILELVSKEYSNWEIDPKPLGNGSFGVVFQMVNRDNGEKRALKVIPIPHDDSEIDRRLVRGYPESEIEKDYTGVKNRVLDEVLNIIQLRTNDNVINIFGYREIRRKERIGWVVCFDMEYLPPLIETKRLNEQQIVRMALDMCNALKSCHARKIVHRDIKPENILQKGDSYVLADFGVSKMANTQSSLSLRGTYDYMAPEIIRQEAYPDVSPDTVDIYSLGITLYVYANQNRLPFVETANDMMYADKRDEMNMKRWNSEVIPAPSGVSERLSKIILCACEKDPHRRYQSAAEMEYDLLHLNTNDFLYCDRMKQLAAYASNRVAVTPPPAAQPMNHPAGYVARPQVSPMQQTMPVQRLQQPAPRAQQTPALRAQQMPVQRGPQMQGNKTPYVPAQKTPQKPAPAKAAPANTPVNKNAQQGTVAVSHLIDQQLPSPTKKPVNKTPVRGAYVQTNQSKATTPGMPDSLQGPPRKSKKKKVIIGLIAGVVVVACVVAGINYIGFETPKKNNQTTTVLNSLPQYSNKDIWYTGATTTKKETSKVSIPKQTTTDQTPHIETSKPSVNATLIDAANAHIDEELYGPTVEHYYDALLGREPSSAEKEKAFSDIRRAHSATDFLIRELLNSNEFESKNYTDSEFVYRVLLTFYWQPADDEEQSSKEAYVQANSREALVELMFKEAWPRDHFVVTVCCENIIGKQEYFVENKSYPDAEYTLKTYIYNAETGGLVTFGGGAFLGQTVVHANQRKAGPKIPDLKVGKYRLVIKKDPHGTVVYDEGFEVK
ncbi:MAG: protein kinase [Clostridiales bacterium]|nr:protein kinase [Clostridiales bacterium]